MHCLVAPLVKLLFVCAVQVCRVCETGVEFNNDVDLKGPAATNLCSSITCPDYAPGFRPKGILEWYLRISFHLQSKKFNEYNRKAE